MATSSPSTASPVSTNPPTISTSMPTSLRPTTDKPSLKPTSAPSASPTLATGSPTKPSGKPTSAPSASPTLATGSPTVPYTRPVIQRYDGTFVTSFMVNTSTGDPLNFTVLQAPVDEFFTASPEVLAAPDTSRLFTIANALNASYAFAELTQGQVPILTRSALPWELSGLNRSTGEILGIGNTSLDLTAFPITCIQFPSQAKPPADFSARLLPLDVSIRPLYGLQVTAYGSTGFVDPASGLMQGFHQQQHDLGWTQYPQNVTQPYFCAITWLGLNLFARDSFQTDVISIAFHDVRNTLVSRNLSYMTFPNDPAYSSYELYLFIGGIPFMALAAACVVCFPSFALLRYCLTYQLAGPCERRCASCAKSCKRCLRRCFCCEGRSSHRLSKHEKAERMQNIGTAEATLVTPDEVVEAAWDSRLRPGAETGLGEEEEDSDEDLLEIDELLHEEHQSMLALKVTHEEESRGILQLKNLPTTRSLLKQWKPTVSFRSHRRVSKRKELRDYQRKIDDVLRPPYIGKRICFLITSLFLFGCCVALVIGLGTRDTSQSNSSLNTLSVVMGQASNVSLLALDRVNVAIDRALRSNQTAARALLLEERDRLARLATFLNPENLRVINDWPRTLGLADGGANAVEYTGMVVEFLSPFLALVSLTFASCTCRWNDLILFENVSICLGAALKGWFIVAAAVAWFVATFAFWQLAILADVCFLPSVLSVPVFNDTLLTEPLPFNPGDSNNYYQPPGMDGQILALFMYQCKFALAPFTNLSVSTSVNPFAVLDVQAGLLNNAVDVLVTNTSMDKAILNETRTIQFFLDSISVSVNCAVMGELMEDGMNALCYQEVVGTFLLFFFLCTIGICLMCIIPCTSFVSPNLYRQWQANKLYERASKETEKIFATKIKGAESRQHMSRSRISRPANRRRSSLRRGPSHAAASNRPRVEETIENPKETINQADDEQPTREQTAAGQVPLLQQNPSAYDMALL